MIPSPSFLRFGLTAVFLAVAALPCRADVTGPIPTSSASDTGGAWLAPLPTAHYSLNPDPQCWGQATQVFARMGEMGAHASQFPTPRVGLRNLARALYDAGILRDDSMAALGAFVAESLGLSIDACL
jgi:hypothetical protein